MGTRCNIHFCYGDGTIAANIYRHSDGYPDGVLPDLDQFFADVQAHTSDTRFDDAEYLASKFVVWQASKHLRGGGPLTFLGVGICLEDHGDIAYVYRVIEWARPCSDDWRTGYEPEDDEDDD